MDNNKDKTKQKERKIHTVLTFKIEKKQNECMCINRDENALNNIIKIVNHQIKFKERPNSYRRDTPCVSFCNSKTNNINNVVFECFLKYRRDNDLIIS
jgi:hypothetical protein